VADLRTSPLTGTGKALTVPGIDFHLTCRREDLAGAERLLDDVLSGLAMQPWRSGSQAHDLVSAALHARLPLPRVSVLTEALLGGEIWDGYRTIVEAQLAEAHGDHAVAVEVT